MNENEVALLIELSKLGLAYVRRVREARGEATDSPLTAEDVARIRIRGVDELIAEGRARVDEEP